MAELAVDKRCVWRLCVVEDVSSKNDDDFLAAKVGVSGWVWVRERPGGGVCVVEDVSSKNDDDFLAAKVGVSGWVWVREIRHLKSCNIKHWRPWLVS